MSNLREGLYIACLLRENDKRYKSDKCPYQNQDEIMSIDCIDPKVCKRCAESPTKKYMDGNTMVYEIPLLFCMYAYAKGEEVQDE